MAAKVAKASVDYSEGKPNGAHCGVCAHFQSPHGCAIVAGQIDAAYWCTRFKAKRRGAVLYRR